MDSRHDLATDFLVVGGGVIGMMLARELAVRGASVRLLERGNCGQEASWAGGGIISPLYPWRYPPAVTALSAWSQAHYPDYVRDLARETGEPVEMLETGLLFLRVEDEAAALQWAGDNRFPLAVIDHVEATRLQPGLRPDLQRALWMPGVCSVRNPRLLRALVAWLRSHPGVSLVEGEAADTLETAAGRVAGVRAGETCYEAARTVVCGGAWSAGLLAPTGYRPPVVPVRGQMLMYGPQPGLLRRIVLSDGRYLIPRADGRILAGSTQEFAGFKRQVTEDAQASLSAAAASMLPALADRVPEAQWCGLRPGAPDGIPVMGAVPGVRDLYVSAGHFRNGLLLAPAAARLVADMLFGRESFADPRDYAPEAAEGPVAEAPAGRG